MRQVILAALAAGLAVIAVIRFANWRQTVAASDDFPDGTFWVCLEPDCGHEFTKSIKDLAAIQQSGGNPAATPCPQCDRTQTTRAGRCKACERFYPLPGRYDPQQPCPRCGKPVTGKPSSPLPAVTP